MGSERRVISSVLEGGAGWERGGSEERSRERGERERLAERPGVERGEEVVEVGGEETVVVRFSVWMGDRSCRGRMSAIVSCGSVQ